MVLLGARVLRFHVKNIPKFDNHVIFYELLIFLYRSTDNSSTVKFVVDKTAEDGAKQVGAEILKSLGKRDLIDTILKEEHDQPSADQEKEYNEPSTSKNQEKNTSNHKHKRSTRLHKSV